MMRTIPAEFAEAPNAPPSAARSFTLDFKITTATYGGGVEAGLSDRITPVRASQCRGLLRFWWRASRGACCATVAALRDEEARIWGSTDHRSPIQIEILNAQLGIETPSDKENPRYALFPAQSNDQHHGSRPIYRGGSFQLKFRCPSGLADELDAALRYWITFSGVGSRTRRGLGALFCGEYPAGAIFSNPADLPGTPARIPWPQLKGGRLAMSAQPFPHQRAWEEAIDALRDFRQERTHKFGRSRWPEPDAIRRLTRSSPDHTAPVNPAGDFPRGRFGGPIIFHFPQKGRSVGDPEDTRLLPASDYAVFERMASPLILKPIAISPTHSVPAALLLNAPQPSRLVLREKDKTEHTVTAGARDVLREFMEHVESKWKVEKFDI